MHIFICIFTLSPGAAASSTRRVTMKKPRALSPPGSLTSISRFLQVQPLTFHTPKHSHVMCLVPNKNTLTQCWKAWRRRQEEHKKKNENRFIPCVCLFRGQPNHKWSKTWVYPCGSFFFQLARTALACMRIGGSPKRCDTSQYGTARLCGSFYKEES